MDSSKNLTTSEKLTENHPEEPLPKVKVTLAPQISFAYHQNSVPLIRDISITNESKNSLQGLVLRMDVSPGFVASKTWNIDSLPSGDEIKVPDRDTRLDGEFLFNLTESMLGEVVFSLFQEEAEITKTVRNIEILARDEWGGYSAQPELLAAFSMPNDPAIDKILSRAAELLKRHGKSNVLDGYRSGTRRRSWEIVSAIWLALGSMGLNYSYPPKSFERTGQKIRTPTRIENGGIATCLDTTMLFCSVIEQAHLHPIVVLKDGHSFAGVWLKPGSFQSVVMDDVTDLRKRIQSNELIVFETTLITQEDVLPFTASIERAKRGLAEEVEDDFVCAIDIQRAREQKIKPLSLAEQTTPGDGQKETETIEPLALDEPPAALDKSDDFGQPEPSSTDETSTETRLEKWQRELLDLSLRNPLLNCHQDRMISIICPNPSLLEDKLSEGKTIHILPLPSTTRDEGRDSDIHDVRTGENLDEETAISALNRNEIYVREDKIKLETRMISLYRKAKADLEEGGTNTLFLALGFLVWKREDSRGKKFRAPLILVPVELKRKSVRSRMKLVLHDDEPRFNTTLLEMLRQDFALDIQGFDDDLPTDASGVDVAEIWAKIRHAIKNV